MQRVAVVSHCVCFVNTVLKNSWTSLAGFSLRKLTKASGHLLEKKVLCLYSFCYNSTVTTTAQDGKSFYSEMRSKCKQCLAL